MGINEELIKRNLTFSANYGSNEFVTNFEIKQIINNKDFFDGIYKYYPLETINNIDDYYNYLFANKIVYLEEIAQKLIHEEHKDLLNKLITDSKDQKSKIKNKDIIKFINASYQNLLKQEFEPYGITDVVDVTIEFIIKFRSGISLEVKEFICRNLGNIVILRYADFEPIIKEEPKLFGELFPQYKLDYIQKYNFTHLLSVLAHIHNNNNLPYFEQNEELIKTLSNDIENLANSLTVDNIMQNYQTIRRYIAFLKRIKHVDANRFEKVQRHLDNLLSESINRNGHTFSIEVPTSLIKKILQSERPIFQRLLYITHTPNIETLNWESHLNNPPEKNHPLIDMVSTNIPTNDYFSFSHQRLLDSIVTVGAVSIHSIFTDEKIINEYLEGYYVIIELISIETDYDVDELLADFELLAQMMGNIFCLPSNSDKIIIHSMCYGAAMFICAFSEKILRLCYFNEMKDDVYIPLNKATIGMLLDVKNPVTVKILGEYQTKHLNFFFGQDTDGVVGRSYRNRLAHWNDISDDDLTPDLICKLFYLFTCIINSVSLYYNKKNEETEKVSKDKE